MSIFDVPPAEYDSRIALTEAALAEVRSRLPGAQAHADAETARLRTVLQQAEQGLEQARRELHRRQARTVPGPRYDVTGAEMGYFARSRPPVPDAEFGNALQRDQQESRADETAEGWFREAEAEHQRVVKEQQAAAAAVSALRQEERRLSAEAERLRYERARAAAGPVPVVAGWGDLAGLRAAPGLLAGVSLSDPGDNANTARER